VRTDHDSDEEARAGSILLTLAVDAGAGACRFMDD
jgi:hypothetical protein